MVGLDSHSISYTCFASPDAYYDMTMALKVHNTITVVCSDIISTVFTIVSVTFIITSLDIAHRMIPCRMTN